MKPHTRMTRRNTQIRPSRPSLAKSRRASSPELVAQMEEARRVICAEFAEALEANRPLLRLALNEAEAIAWQTAYPHLVFPSLAREKAEVVAAWHVRQRSMWRSEGTRGFAV